MVETDRLPEGTIRLPVEVASEFIVSAFSAAGVPAEDSELVADVLTSADVRGIRSHGLARMSYFLVRIERGVINREPDMRLSRGSDTTVTMDADRAVGIVSASKAMEESIAMAGRHGSGFVTVGNSSHFGYAGYWARMAMDAGCIGISMSSGGRRVAPTFGSESVFGTNPMAVGIPAFGRTVDFYLDMATSAVAVGKIETALREGRPLSPGWVADTGTPPGLDDNGVLSYSAPLLPLGGEGDDTGGHKGYGLALMIELLAGALAGTPLTDRLAGAAGMAAPAMGHFMGAISVRGFGDEQRIGDVMADTFETVRSSGKSPGQDRIFIHGEPEAIAEEQNREEGIAVTPAVQDQIRRWNEHFSLGFDM